jgi:hypothetical protein
VDDAVNADLGVPAEPRALKNRDPGGEKDFILERAAI